MFEIRMLRTWMLFHVHELQRQRREEPDRGDIVQTIVYTALAVGLTIAVVAIIASKVKSAANNIKTQ